MPVAAAPILCLFQLVRANSDIIHLLMGVVYTRPRLLSVNHHRLDDWFLVESE